MPILFFRCRGHPPQVLTSTQPGKVMYRLQQGGHWVGQWAGVIEQEIARGLRPFSQPVILDFGAYQIGDQGWTAIEADAAMWGCLLKGAGRGESAVFVLVSGGQPLLTNTHRR